MPKQLDMQERNLCRTHGAAFLSAATRRNTGNQLMQLPADTPERFYKWLRWSTSGEHEDPHIHLETVFKRGAVKQPVLVRDIPFVSVCEHHLLPFHGHAHVCYQPGNRGIVGLSKIARVVDALARRLQLQETLTDQIGAVISGSHALQPLGVVVQVQATHSCMSLRGVKAHDANTTTRATWGTYDDLHQRELLALLGER